MMSYRLWRPYERKNDSSFIKKNTEKLIVGARAIIVDSLLLYIRGKKVDVISS